MLVSIGRIQTQSIIVSLASHNLTIPKLLGSFVRARFMDEEIVGSPRFWEGANPATLVFRELPLKDVEVLSHPLLVEAFSYHAIALLVHPPNAHLQHPK